MESFYGAENCEIVGIFLLWKIAYEFDNECTNLYRDDRLLRKEENDEVFFKSTTA